jgi:hypothetical protein
MSNRVYQVKTSYGTEDATMPQVAEIWESERHASRSEPVISYRGRKLVLNIDPVPTNGAYVTAKVSLVYRGEVVDSAEISYVDY